MNDFTPRPPAPPVHRPHRTDDLRGCGALLTGIGFAALGLGAGLWFAVSALMGVFR
jgi:hypothetical protein